ncbi:MAG: hypothetical protein AUJ75_00565 [Candidatus Omnitrophica bacterium CG1_02_49_10]|nr:MAG: hypothetical protein AUJ75_00565 [Candidatus Omnitrophica bacterium CG1_02_49_10]
MDTDKLLHDIALREIAGMRPGRTDRCPSEFDLVDHINGHLSAESAKKIRGHIAGCLYCLEQIEEVKHHIHLHEDKDAHRPSQELVERVKKMEHSSGGTLKGEGHAGRSSSKQHLWLIAAITSFGISFIVHRYFIQFLVLSAILAVKWIALTSGTRSLLMVYEDWRDKRNINNPNKLQDRFKSAPKL